MRYSTAASGRQDCLLFSHSGAAHSEYLALRLSYDEAVTWPFSRRVFEGAAGYSQLAVLSDLRILVLFEAGRYDSRESITLTRMPLVWPENGAGDEGPNRKSRRQP